MIVHASVPEVAARRPQLAGVLTPIDAARCEYRPSDADVEWLALRVVMLGFDFEVREPPELVERLRALAGRLERAAGVSPPGAA